MEAIKKYLEGNAVVTTDELIAAFDKAASCVTPGCDLQPLHEIAGEIATKLRDYRDWAEEPGQDREAISIRKRELMADMNAFGLMVTLMEVASVLDVASAPVTTSMN